MKKTILLLLSSLLLAQNEIAQNDETLNLLDDLNDVSEISTKTKLNMDKTPAVVSVLHADELQKLGITNVYTALESVPGIEISMGIGGAKQINMRGNKSIVTDKIKFMIDGISINNELTGANHFYLNMPIENIERIEIIRGPASALYGSFAHIGVINIITKASTESSNTLFIRGSSKGSNNAGFTQHANTQDLKIGLTGSFEDNAASREYANYSALPSNLKYKSYEDFSSLTLGMNITFYKDIHFISKYLDLNTQNYFGYGAWPIVQDPKTLEHKSFVNEFSYTPRISKDLTLNIRLGHKFYSMTGQSRLAPTSLNPAHYDLIGDGDYSEKTLYTDLSLNYVLQAHNIIFGTYLSNTNADGTTYYTNNPAVSEETNIPLQGGGLQDKITRKQYALYMSDIYDISQKWSTNLGLRYDSFSDADSALSPKLALLYSYSEKQSYKLMYQRSFRVPSFVEFYGTNAPFKGDKNLKSETIDTVEFAYRYQNSFDSWLSLNFFYSDMQDFIYRDPGFNLKNGEDSTSYGSELEFVAPLFERLSLRANYSYVYMEDKEHNKIPFISNHLANALLSYQITSAWHSGTKVRFVGNIAREENDPRNEIKHRTTLDQTLTYTHKSLSLQASLKNIFDTDIIYPTPLGNLPSSGTYEDDLHRDGRTFLLSAEWRFE